MNVLAGNAPLVLFLALALTAKAHGMSGSGTLLQPWRMDLLREGRPIGFVTLAPGTRVELLSTNAEGWLVRRFPDDTHFTVPKETVQVNSEPATPIATSPVPSSFPSPAPPVIPASSPAAIASTGSLVSLPVASPDRPQKSEPDAAAVDKALGIPLFGKGDLWQESDASVAGRLKWPLESKTSSEAGYRRYPYTFNSETRILGVRALSLFLQGIADHPARIMILFSNMGDITAYATPEEAKRQRGSKSLIVTDPMLKACRDAMERDRMAIQAALTSLLGDARPVRLGRFASLAENARRWDWKGTSFLLTSPRNQYVALRILPTALLEDQDSATKALAAARASLAGRVEHRSNGDVIITDLPMVDQGRKGYCVPATFERLLRYYGLSEDMNVLAMAGQTGPGGGTRIADIQAATYSLLADAGARVLHPNFTGSLLEIKPFIDAGKPVLFPLFSTQRFNKRVDERMARRVNITDWKEWREKFLPSMRKTEPLPQDPEWGHVCLIIGYNESTREIAISDSWGPAATERWMTEEEARQVRQGQSVTVIE